MEGRWCLLAMSALVLLCPGPAAAQGDLERARSLYNAGQFEESIAAATSAKRRPAAAPSATLIIARARLERFRTSGDPTELVAARADLVSLDPRMLAPQEGIEWQIGVGSALFLEEQFGPAAETFAALLPAARGRLPQPEFEKLLEWWGGTLSRLAETLDGEARRLVYDRFRAEARLEVERNPFSRPATYWLVVSLRGAGDLDAAWGAAVSGWIRAGTEPEGRKLRTDLERLVTQTLIPERAQAPAGPSPTTADMEEAWRTVIGRWDK